MSTPWTTAVDFPLLALVGVLSFVWAKLEIQIEGPEGWAKNLPTWRVEKHWIADLVLGGAEITGYHFWAFLATLLFFHLPLTVQRWTVAGEARAWGCQTLFWLLEDYLWFVLNPHYGWRALNPQRVWWHRRWFWGWPANYWMMAPVGVVLYLAPVFF
ncbi:MAG: hypothetical protein IPP68_02810 [Elusimicrobia bacterium]|nr:hypothetical protein [Elusimicrobiota bacterium]